MTFLSGTRGKVHESALIDADVVKTIADAGTARRFDLLRLLHFRKAAEVVKTPSTEPLVPTAYLDWIFRRTPNSP